MRPSFTPDARNDLHSIWEYIAQDDISAADRVIVKIEEAANLLARRPGLGHERKDLTDLPVRFWPVYSYLIIYRPETKPLQIVRVVSAFRDLVTLLS